jgi:hypothetical protein
MTKYPLVTSVVEAVNLVNAGSSFDIKTSDGEKLTLHLDAVGYWGYDDEYGRESVFAMDSEKCITRLAAELKN